MVPLWGMLAISSRGTFPGLGCGCVSVRGGNRLCPVDHHVGQWLVGWQLVLEVSGAQVDREASELRVVRYGPGPRVNSCERLLERVEFG